MVFKCFRTSFILFFVFGRGCCGAYPWQQAVPLPALPNPKTLIKACSELPSTKAEVIKIIAIKDIIHTFYYICALKHHHREQQTAH